MVDKSLEFRVDGVVLFSSAGRWLHPLFELERYLKESGADAARGEIRDKVVGRASAFLILRMGVRKVHAELLSRLGKEVLEKAGIAHSWDRLVDEIQCRTESLLRGETDPEAAYRLIAERAAKASKGPQP
jgi:hypothetical protein